MKIEKKIFVALADRFDQLEARDYQNPAIKITIAVLGEKGGRATGAGPAPAPSRPIPRAGCSAASMPTKAASAAMTSR